MTRLRCVTIDCLVYACNSETPSVDIIEWATDFRYSTFVLRKIISEICSVYPFFCLRLLLSMTMETVVGVSAKASAVTAISLSAHR